MKDKCQIFKPCISHWGNKALKRCKSIATNEINGKKVCVNCFRDIAFKKDKP